VSHDRFGIGELRCAARQARRSSCHRRRGACPPQPAVALIIGGRLAPASAPPWPGRIFSSRLILVRPPGGPICLRARLRALSYSAIGARPAAKPNGRLRPAARFRFSCAHSSSPCASRRSLDLVTSSATCQLYQPGFSARFNNARQTASACSAAAEVRDVRIPAHRRTIRMKCARHRRLGDPPRRVDARWHSHEEAAPSFIRGSTGGAPSHAVAAEDAERSSLPSPRHDQARKVVAPT